MPDISPILAKNIASLKKRILKVEYDYSFKLIGLVTPEKDYRISWFLNEYIKTDFVRKEDIIIDRQEKSKKLFFCKYHFFDNEDKVEYFLLGNKCNGDFLLPEWKEIDFFLKISSELTDEQVLELIESLKLIPIIQLVREIFTGSLKSMDNLIFD